MAFRVQFTLQGKGGVGKSFAAALIAQYYLRHLGRPFVCVDTDPLNATLAGYAALKVRRHELMKDNALDPRRFDGLMSSIASEESDFIVDSGSSCFIALTNYLHSSNALRVLSSMGREIYVHTVVTGGYGLRDTLAGFEVLAQTLPPEARLIVWLNDYFGPIEAEGLTFKEMKVYQRNQARVFSLIRLRKQDELLVGRDLQEMLEHRLTFAEALEGPFFNLFAKQRLAGLERELLNEMAPLA